MGRPRKNQTVKYKTLPSTSVFVNHFEFLDVDGLFCYGFNNESSIESQIEENVLKNGRVVMRTNHSFVLGEVIDGVYKSEYKQPRVVKLSYVKITYTNGDTEVMLKKRLLEHTGLDNVLMKEYDKENELYRFHYICKVEKVTDK